MAEMGQIRVLHCAETIKGGIATYLRDLIPLQCAEFGAQNVFLVIPASQTEELPVPEGVRVDVYQNGRGRLRNALSLAWRVAVVARSLRVQVVHIHSTFAGVLVRPVLTLLYRAACVVYCPHGWAWDRPLCRSKRFAVVIVERFLALFCDRVVCISEHERKTALEAGISETRLVLVRNGVRARAPDPSGEPPVWPESCMRVLFVGRFDQQKGVDILFCALRKLGRQAYAIVAGSPVLADSWSFVLPDNAKCIGWVSPGRLETLFASADVLVVPSRWEGFGLIAAEAMRAGLAVVAAGVGGLPEVVQDRVTGRVFAAGSVDALVGALSQVSRDDWRRMGAAGKAHFAEHFTMDRVHRELCAVYGVMP